MRLRNTPILAVLGPILVASAVLAGTSGPTGFNLAYGAHGPALDGSAGAPVPLGPHAFLAPCRGPDGNTTSWRTRSDSADSSATTVPSG